ncbi:AMP-binding protein [Porphyromonas gingivicanis]|uniref:AMP-binding protein n=1 Tax=Porphyromonas gingivicanis TaxID=266762 RepID=UPI001F57034F|nr:AMP-binding protein [Porphyromonas gingivicanis]
MKPSSKQHSVFQALIKLQFITPQGVYRWIKSLLSEGTTLMALLRFSAETYPYQTALLPAEGETLTYRDLYKQSRQLAYLLREHYGLRAGHRVGILCRNHTMAVLLLPAYLVLVYTRIYSIRRWEPKNWRLYSTRAKGISYFFLTKIFVSSRSLRLFLPLLLR